MKLSIIIVSYNVSAFLENTLLSVYRALSGIEAEVFVVDNASVDDSVFMVSTKFPGVQLIENKVNLGFSKANNQAIRRAVGEYILLLNPDTIVNEDTFSMCIAFMDAHPDAGALGVKMVDGSGTFLPESKRGFPTPFAAFCKMSGLSRMFPSSPFFNRYYLGHLDPEKTHPVEVLCGAYMFIRKKVLDKTGLLDEAYFMYGEDIDLSYRIIKAGFVNYYLPDTSIIHYKGESTKKASLKYVNTFYNAMFIFLRKHYSHQTGSPFLAMVKLGILARAFVGAVHRLFQRVRLVLVDMVCIVGGLLLIKVFWSRVYFGDPDHFNPAFDWVNVPLYTLLWIFFIYLTGGYDKRSSSRTWPGVLLGTLCILMVYAMLPLSLRSSRAIILLGAVWTLLATWLARIIPGRFRGATGMQDRRHQKRTLVVGQKQNARQIMDMVDRTDAPVKVVGCISAEPDNPEPDFYINTMDKLPEIVRLYRIEELIFSARDVPFSVMSGLMSRLGPEVEYKIASEESYAIVGSRSKDTAGELYTLEIQFRIDLPVQKRNKRIFDIVFAVIFLIGTPVWIFMVKNKRGFFKNCTDVLLHRRTWVGYDRRDRYIQELPILKPGVLSALHLSDLEVEHVRGVHMGNFVYAKEYSIWKDLEILSSGIRELGTRQSREY